MKRLIILITILVAFSSSLRAAPLPSTVLRSVVFIYVRSSDGKFLPLGTGFWLGKVGSDKNFEWTALVTAKHVIAGREAIWLRLNKVDGNSDFVPIQIVRWGVHKNLYLNQDDNVGVAVIKAALPDPRSYEVTYIPVEALTPSSEMTSEMIGPGTDLFFVGMFVPYLGQQQAEPIVRFGRLAMIPKEKIDFVQKPQNLLLAEMMSFGGNSGSPVFYYYGIDSRPNAVIGGRTQIKLAGIMEGYFSSDPRPLVDIEIPSQFQTSKASIETSGIAAITPAQKILDIVNASAF